MIMSITCFVPEVWSESMMHALDGKYVGVANCNREFEGDIKEKGNTVRICGLNAITVADYTKNTDISAPESLTDSARKLTVDQAKYFNFQIDDLDRVQSRPAIMNTAIHNAAQVLAAAADKYIYTLTKYAGKSITCTPATATELIDMIVDARTKLFAANVIDPSDIVVEISPDVAAQILKAKATLCTDNSDCLERGYIGSIAGCKIFVSNQINVEEDSAGTTVTHHCLARTRRAIAFAEQLSQIEAYRPESRFADAVKGLHLYGAKVIYPQELVEMNVVYSTAD